MMSIRTPTTNKPYLKNKKGFTILEVIISLVIVTISITTFIQLLGNSSLIRSKISDHEERLIVAITKSEQIFLGLLGDTNNVSGSGKKKLQGKTPERGINWSVEKEVKDTTDGGGNVYFYTVNVEGIELSSVTLR